MSSVVSTTLNPHQLSHHRSEPSGMHLSSSRPTTVESSSTQQQLQAESPASTSLSSTTQSFGPLHKDSPAVKVEQDLRTWEKGMESAQPARGVTASSANSVGSTGATNTETDANTNGTQGSDGGMYTAQRHSHAEEENESVEDEETRWLKSLPDAELPDAFEDEPGTPPRKGFTGTFPRTHAADDSGVAALAALEPFGTPGVSGASTSTISNSSSRGGTRAPTTPLMPRNPAAWVSQSQPYTMPMDPTSAATLAASGAFDMGLPPLSLATNTWSGQDDTSMPVGWPSYTTPPQQQQQQKQQQHINQKPNNRQQQRPRQQVSAPGSTSISPPLQVEDTSASTALPQQSFAQRHSQVGGGFQPMLQGGPPQHPQQQQQQRTKSLSAEPNAMYSGGAGMMVPPSGAAEWVISGPGAPYVPAGGARAHGLYHQQQQQAPHMHGGQFPQQPHQPQQQQQPHQPHMGPRRPGPASHVSQLQPIPQEPVAPPQQVQQQSQHLPPLPQQGQQQFPPQQYAPHQPGFMAPQNHRYMRAHSEPGPAVQLPPPGAQHTPQHFVGAMMEDPVSSFAPFVFPGAPMGHATEFNRDSRDNRRRPSSGRGGTERAAPRRGHNSLSSAFRRLNLDSSTRLRDLTGRIVELSADQHGSRMIQHCVESATPAEMHKVLEEIGEQLYQVMTDVFGNYVIQKLLQYGDGTVQHTIVHGMQGRVPALSMHNYGCRVVQEVLATVTSVELRNLVLEELESYNVSDLIMDQHANHVIQKCVTSLPTDNLGFVITACERQASTMSRHLYGCRVIQRLIEQCEPEQLEVVYTNVLADCSLLMKNAYGNYVIQHVLEHGKQEHCDVVMDGVSGKLLTLSQHKFASNVVEKFLRVARADQISSLVAELCHSTALPDGTTAAPLHVMMKDKYANYVIQTLMQCSPQQTQTALLDYIHANRDVLRGYTYGKHIVAKAEALRSQRR